MLSPQTQYRDRLFNFIFGSDEHREWTLDLYNAVNHTSYTDPDLIEFTTIREVLYLGMRNDVSFLISDLMNLWEQQSTFNPNMPLRMMEYTAQLYERFITQNRKNKFGKRQIMLPVPRLVVFYNGQDEKEDVVTLRLSDAFPEALRPLANIEVEVTMLNINYGHNQAFLQACRPLTEYAWVVERVHENRRRLKGLVPEEKLLEVAIDRMIDEMPDKYVLKPYLEEHRAEVKGMLLTEYDEVKTMELFKEEGREEGRQEGRQEGREEGREEGMARGMGLFGELISKLLSAGRVDDAARASTDPVWRDRLLSEFQLI